MSSTSKYWSPLCETDRAAYALYLFCEYGSSTGIHIDGSGAGAYSRRHGGCIDHGVGTIAAGCGDGDSGSPSRCSDGIDFDRFGRFEDFVGHCIGGKALTGDSSVDGFSGIVLGDSISGSDSGVVDGLGDGSIVNGQSGDAAADGGSVDESSSQRHRAEEVLGDDVDCRPVREIVKYKPGFGVHRDKNRRKRENRARREAKGNFFSMKENSSSESKQFECVKDGDWRVSSPEAVSQEVRRSWEERRIAENRLAVQKANYQYRYNEYKDKSRVSEQRWEMDRLRLDDQTRRVVNSRAAACGGNVETIVSGSEALEKGTISPNSSISVDEERKLRARVESSESQVKELTLQLEKLKAQVVESLSDSNSDVELFPVTDKGSGNVHKDGFGRKQDYGPVPQNAVGFDGVDHFGRPRYYDGDGFRLTVDGGERGPGPTTALSQPDVVYFL